MLATLNVSHSCSEAQHINESLYGFSLWFINYDGLNSVVSDQEVSGKKLAVRCEYPGWPLSSLRPFKEHFLPTAEMSAGSSMRLIGHGKTFPRDIKILNLIRKCVHFSPCVLRQSSYQFGQRKNTDQDWSSELMKTLSYVSGWRN